MSFENLAAARDILRSVRAHYPAPLATVAGELLYELSAARPSAMRVFLLEIDLFEVSVAFFAFVQVAQLHQSRLELKRAQEAVRQLRDSDGLTTGSWWGLLRETSRDVGGLPAKTRLAEELARLYYDEAGEAAKPGKLLDLVPGMRNRVKGHTWTLADEQYERHADELLGSVAAYLRYLEFLERYVLFQCLACERDGEGHALDLAELTGDARRSGRLQTTATAALVPGHLYVARRDELQAGHLEASAVLGLHPFVQCHGREARPDAVYLMQALRDGEAELHSAVGGHTFRDAVSGRLARGLLDDLLGLSAGKSGPFAELRDAVAAITREALASPQGRASYRAQAYLVRPRLLRQVENFVESGPGLALLAAPSGMGKTALACYLADRWLLSANATEAVLLVFAHELAAAGESLGHWARRRLGQSLQEAGAIAAKAGGRILVLVDALERARDARELLHEADTLRGSDLPLHFLFTVTESALPLDRRVVPEATGRPTQFVVIPPLNRDEGQKLLALFRGDGAAGAPEELLTTLGTPLLIRLAQESARAGDVTAGQVLLAYAERVVFSDLSRAEFVAQLADRLLEADARAVPAADLARDAWMRAALLSDTPDSPLRGLVRDGILFVEWVPPEGGLPLPGEARIGFTFDLLRDFVVFTRLCRPGGGDTEPLLALAARTGPASPLVGGLRVLVLERLRKAGDTVPEAVVDLLARMAGGPRQALVQELFMTAAGPRLAAPLAALLRALFARLDAEGRGAFLDAARAAFSRLERRGQADQAGALAELAADAAGPDHAERVLPLLCAWARVQLRNVSAGAAATTARRAEEAAKDLPDRSPRVEARACLAEALYLSGRRKEAAEVARQLLDEAADGLSVEAELMQCLAVARVLHEALPEVAGRALARARALADTQGTDHARALAGLAELGMAMGSPKNIGSQRCLDLAEQTLRQARAAGHAALEAEACRLAAWAWQNDPGRELALVEAGLEAAEAARDLAARAELLVRQAHWHLVVGQPRAAATPAQEAADLFDRLQYRERALRLRLRILALGAWELGRPGEALALCREALPGFRDLDMPGEAALAALLIALILCDVGDRAAADDMLAQSQALAQQSGGTPLNYDLVRGRIRQLAGDVEGALAAYAGARAWGVSARYADFVYQPGLHAARLLLDRADRSAEDLNRARTLLQELLVDDTVDRRQRERYDGELALLFARLYVERGQADEARTWLVKADEWFARDPRHRAAPEWQAMRLVLDWTAADRLEQEAAAWAADKSKVREAKAARGKATGLRLGVRKRVRPEVLDVVEKEMAATFSERLQAESYVANHPAVRLLKRYGIGAE